MSSVNARIKVENAAYHYDGQLIPLMSGEFHYWRVPAENWGVIADRIVELGLKTIATYIPWNYHELEPEVYDFHGDTSPQRNLDGFLTLMEQKGLYVIVRPGPYIYSEWIHGGVPERATKFHRLSPEFLKMSKHYIDAVAKVIEPHQITRGGRVIICQADNEAYPPIESLGSEMGGFERDGEFKDFLRQKYHHEIAVLNRAWHTAYADFTQACIYFHEAYVNTEQPMAERLLVGSAYRMRYFDTFEFIGQYAARIIANVANWLRAAGIDIPISSNGWSPLYQNFRTMTETVDLCGCDIYPEQFIDGTKIVKDNWFYNFDIIRLQEADVTHGNVWSAEFQSGNFPLHTVGYLVPQHHRFITLAALTSGLKGLNYYMLVNRDNWYNCPINEWGRTNEYYEPVRSALKLVETVEPWKCENQYDLSLFCFKPHRVIDPGNFETCFNALTDSDISFCYFNPETMPAPRTRVLLYAGGDWLTREAAETLHRFVAQGGTLVAFNRYPQTDEFGEPLNLGFSDPDGARPVFLPITVNFGKNRFEITEGGHNNCKVNFFYYHQIQGDPIEVAISTSAKEFLVDLSAPNEHHFMAGYVRSCGRGRIIHVGCGATGQVIRNILGYCGIAPQVNTRDPRVLTTILQHESGRRFIAVINRNDHMVWPEITFAQKWNGRLINLEDGTMVGLAADMPVRLSLPPHDVKVWELVTNSSNENRFSAS